MKHSCTSRAVAELLTQVGRLAHSRGFTGGLNPAQWMALRYFSQANESVATVMKFAEHYGSSRGTASQSISALVRKGYLARQPSRGKKSSHVLALTEAGRALIAQDPINHLIDGIEGLPDSKKPVFAESLEFLIRYLFETDRDHGDALEPSE
ncbi:MarR family winged helix-turn-helix transcriptional regulator [Pararhodospirillum oryzae]|uniref:MarR family transcriptional regulator n=1 Tax=Pararhodospirillum oryzae TaxID=478448 RepID=A0A512H6I3_9PROT|nr:MarR family transcriptional regulator [Pararhodospirillum oryzae]GEO81085.1 MarR family transcriptional regulator [Pararhodospirillum oryzae]